MPDYTHFVWLAVVMIGFLAGLVDSVAGGGGLITVPTFMLMLGPGADAIGTNKMVAVVVSFVALGVYLRKGHVRLKGIWLFVLLTGLGAVAGALVAPLVPGVVYKFLILALTPAILFVVLNKKWWSETSARSREYPTYLFWGSGLVCGFYDGVAGPGGGTLMFLSLLVLGKSPLLEAMGTAKVANLTSAVCSLVIFSSLGHVFWQKGVGMAVGVAFGAAIGASFAITRAAPVARAALVIVSGLLLVKLFY